MGQWSWLALLHPCSCVTVIHALLFLGMCWHSWPSSVVHCYAYLTCPASCPSASGGGEKGIEIQLGNEMWDLRVHSEVKETELYLNCVCMQSYSIK